LDLLDVPETATPASWSDETLEAFLRNAVGVTQEDRKQNQILYYQPASAKAQAIHDCAAKVVGVGGGNGSGKSDTVLVDAMMCATGVFPYSQRHLIEQKFKGPIAVRLVVESLTTTLEPIILPKLQWWKWSGVDQAGGERGHWGWIPKNCLIDGDWQKSWNAKLRMLTVLCRDPHDNDKVLGQSTIQCMSVDQDPSDFASGDFHIVIHDEPPKLAQWRENEARVMRVDGRIMLAMTWPDDPSINVDWLYNEVYEPGKQGGDPNIAWFELWSTDNKNLKQERVAQQAAKWSTEITNVRVYGRPIRFSNRIHPEFTDQTKTWCYSCGKPSLPVQGESGRRICSTCGDERLTDYCHVQDFPTSATWPSVFVLDPHPRKPHMWLWAQIDPSDDWWIVADGELDKDCVEVRKAVERTETELGLHTARRLMDPNMGASPSGQHREVSWQDEFRDAGLSCELADDSGVGRQRVNTFLRPDPHTLRPRAVIHPRCKNAIYQMNRFSWSDFSKNVDRDQKQTPSDKYSDYPAMLRYLANSDPVFNFLKMGAPVIRRPGQRRGAY
jgi:hypothetical protein